ncbi:NTE family protein [Chelatococcus caeni]|uniref:NTE family protein n=1 Tax=Chelatococcus caeni TaxID=1348468 RepID=A0A840BXD0_9HYPH|nr:patatin-like phospholipase family protein [Chelatococcus caeni]MBB4017724.1 NTE family protein [Chelatococcus caeni]
MFEDIASLAATMAVEPDPTLPLKRRPFGIALGGGAARGWAHIGIMRVLAREGLVPHVIAGTSIGAVVGGCFACDKLDELEDFARSLTKRRVMGLMDFHLNGSGLIAGQRLRRMLSHHLGDIRIEALAPRFVAIATELGSGHEIWLTRGSITEALRASYALPGIFDAVRLGGRWLMDGALVNPIPVTAARALGAEIVLCVNLNGSDTRGRGAVIPAHGTDEDLIEEEAQAARGLFAPVRGAAMRMRQFGRRSDGAPGIGAVMVDAFNITQDRIARSRLAGDPPDVMVSPRLGRMGLFDFHRADEAIALGMEAAERALDELREMLEVPLAEQG